MKVSYLIFFIICITSCRENKEMTTYSNSKIALLVSVERTDLSEDYDNNATLDGDTYRDNIEESLDELDFDDIKKLSSPSADTFLKSLKNSIKKLNDNDLLVFYFYGHGGQKYDSSGDEQSDSEDETLVLKDREVLDDEIYEILNGFNKKSKIIIIIEACNSGSSIKFHNYENPTMHISLNEERPKPSLDIIYMGATTDGASVPSDAFNDVLIEVLSDDRIGDYYEFTAELSSLMKQYHNIIPTIDINWASQSFLESEPFK